MEFRLLGPFDVVVDGRSVPLGGTKQRALLAMLAIHANEVLPADRLIDALWPERTPDSAVNTLQGYVSRLRRALDPDRLNGAEQTIAFRQPGYVLQARPDQVDANRFERLVEGAEDRIARGSPTEGAELLREALALWRGSALSDFVYEPFAQAEILRLEELRLKAIEERIDADLACGRHSALVPELEALVAEHPFRERPLGQLMLALYRSGRQGEALSIYREARRNLKDELGSSRPQPSASSSGQSFAMMHRSKRRFVADLRRSSRICLGRFGSSRRRGSQWRRSRSDSLSGQTLGVPPLRSPPTRSR